MRSGPRAVADILPAKIPKDAGRNKPTARRKDGKPYASSSTYRRRIFAREYVKDYNTTQAAIRAGYSERSAHFIGHQLLRRDDVKEMVAALKAEVEAIAKQEFRVDSTTVLRELCRLGLYDIRRLYAPDGQLLPVHDWPDDVAAAVVSIETETRREGSGENAEIVVVRKVKLADKSPNLDKLARHLGLYEKDNGQRGAAALAAALAMIDGKTANLIDGTATRLGSE